MMASPLSGTGIGYVYVHGTQSPRMAHRLAVFEVAINFSQIPPVVQRVLPIAIEGTYTATSIARSSYPVTSGRARAMPSGSM